VYRCDPALGEFLSVMLTIALISKIAKQLLAIVERRLTGGGDGNGIIDGYLFH
jgi:hypothetical protein